MRLPIDTFLWKKCNDCQLYFHANFAIHLKESLKFDVVFYFDPVLNRM